VYSFGVLLIKLLNGSPFILNGNEVSFTNSSNGHKRFRWKKMDLNKIFNVVIDNSIIGFDDNEAKSFLEISLQCIKVIFVPNLLCASFNLLLNKFEKPKSWI